MFVCLSVSCITANVIRPTSLKLDDMTGPTSRKILLTSGCYPVPGTDSGSPLPPVGHI